MLAGASFALAAPPRGWWALGVLGVTALALALRGRSARQRVVVGLVAGAAYYGPSLAFVTDFSPPGYLVLVLLQCAALAAACALLPAAAAGRWSGGWWALPAVLVLLEAVQARAPFGGFPLTALALSQVDGPLATAAPLGGPLLVTALAATAGTALAALLLPGRRRRLTTVVAVLAAVGVLSAAGAAVRTTPAGTLDAAVVQGGGPRGIPAVFSDPAEVTQRHLALARGIEGSPGLVLLPENVADVAGPVAGSPLGERLGRLASELGSPVVVGVTERTRDAFRNAAVLWGPDGALVGRYEKEHRVPFGEYLPARALVERLSDQAALVPRDAVPGRGTALLAAPLAPMAVVISYEVFFPDRVREGVLAGGRVVLVPTNASSYVTEQVPAIQVATARLRAMETGRALLQAGPTGYSAVILPDGQVLARSVLEQPAVLRERVPLRTGTTPYTATGDVPLIALAALALLAASLVRAARGGGATPRT